MCIGDKLVVVHYKSWYWVCSENCLEYTKTFICKHDKVKTIKGDFEIKLFDVKRTDNPELDLGKAFQKAKKWCEEKNDRFYTLIDEEIVQ